MELASTCHLDSACLQAPKAHSSPGRATQQEVPFVYRAMRREERVRNDLRLLDHPALPCAVS